MTEFPNRPARPWDLFNKNIGRVRNDIKEKRMAICRECEFFNSLTQICSQCGCIMPAKTSLPNASCPVHKWEQEDVSAVGFDDQE